MNNTPNLRTFIEQQLRERSMSAREFARFVGVSSSTISRAMAHDNTSEPSLTFLSKLANATNTDLCTLVELIVPNSRGNINPQIIRIAERIDKLPVSAQELLDSVIFGLSLQRDK